jgi:hypothetical protein
MAIQQRVSNLQSLSISLEREGLLAQPTFLSRISMNTCRLSTTDLASGSALAILHDSRGALGPHGVCLDECISPQIPNHHLEARPLRYVAV